MLFNKKTRKRGIVNRGKITSLVISNENMDDIIKLMKLLENSV